MARKVRVEFPGAVYHVMNRSNHQEPIFRDDADRNTFLKTLGEACEKTGWRVHAYVLMGNHYHLLLETPEPNLVVGMKWLQSTYTQRFNSRHRVYGHLFQGRYKALNVVGDDDYFQVVSTYIHLNPVRAKLVRAQPGALKGFQWSSYPEYLARPAKRPTWLVTERVLAAVGVGRDDSRGRRGYEVWIEGRVLECSGKSRKALEEQWRGIRRGWYLGDVQFKEQLLEQMAAEPSERQRDSVDGEAARAHDEHAAEAWLKRALKRLKLNARDLEKSPKGSPEKQVLAWWLRGNSTMSRDWIAKRLTMGHPSRVTAARTAVTNARRGRLTKLRGLVEGCK